MAQSLSDERLTRLPVFPLASAQLFPDTLLPLHVFEPRYVALLHHCLAHLEGAMAVARLEPGFEADYQGRPPIRSVMGAGRVVAAAETDAGSWNIVVRGHDRVRLLEELPPRRAFREARVERLFRRGASKDDPRYSRLRLMVARVASQVDEARPALNMVLENARDPERLVHLLGAHVIAEAEVRCRLMEANDVGVALEIAQRAMAEVLLEAGTRDGEYSTLH